MIVPAESQSPTVVDYPDDDGNPMSDNTLQFQWIVTLQGGLDDVFRDNPDVFVAGNLLWYPVLGDNTTCVAPDALVAFGRPKGYRGSYQQWHENGVAPQVVFEVLSPSNGPSEMARKRLFYEQYGVEEFYIYDPDDIVLTGFIRSRTGALQGIPNVNGFTSPRLGIRFDMSGTELVIHRPDGGQFLTYLDQCARAAQEAERADQTQEAQRADELQRSLERLRAKMIAAGLDPDANDA